MLSDRWQSLVARLFPSSRKHKPTRQSKKQPSRAPRPALERLEDRVNPSPNLQAGGSVHLPFTAAEVEGSAGATVVSTNPQVNPTLLDFTDPTATTADYRVTITWGDGSSDTFLSTNAAAPALVTRTGGEFPGFHVVPTATTANAHVYVEAASGNLFTVQVTDVGSGASTG